MTKEEFITAQILGIVATIILTISYIVKNKKKFLIMATFGDLIYGLSFIFVHSWSLTIIVCISCIQNITYFIYTQKNKETPNILVAIFIILFLIGGIINFKTYWDIIPIFAYIWFTIFLKCKSMRKIRIMFLLPNIMLVFYDIIVMAYGSALEDLIEATFLLILIIRDFIQAKNIKNSKTINNSNEVSNSNNNKKQLNDINRKIKLKNNDNTNNAK